MSKNSWGFELPDSGDEIDKVIELGDKLPDSGTAVVSFEMKEGTKLYSFKFN